MAEVNQAQAAVRQASSSLNNAISRPSDGGKSSLEKNDFLKLLMAQVTNQDPLNPMDSEGMMAQMTSMGSLEQLINLNKQIGMLNSTQTEIAKSNAYSFLDKDVTVRGGVANVTSGTSPDLQFQLPREASSVRVVISDEQGNPVRQIELGQVARGRQFVPWDARDSDGDPVGDGIYRFQVAASSADDQPISVKLFMRGKVSGVKFIDGKPVVLMNGQAINTRDILELSNASERLFGNRQPRPLREQLKPMAPIPAPRKEAPQ